MMPPKRSVLEDDVERLRIWAPMLLQVCEESGEPPYRLAALMLRESGAGWGHGYYPKGDPCGWGDGATPLNPERGWAFGLFQIDKRFHREFVNNLAKRCDPLEQGMYACKVLRDARSWLQRNPACSLRGEALEQAVYAAYNAGPGGVWRVLKEGKHPDAATTRGNYSQWIWAKEAELKQAAPDLFQVGVA